MWDNIVDVKHKAIAAHRSTFVDIGSSKYQLVIYVFFLQYMSL